MGIKKSLETTIVGALRISLSFLSIRDQGPLFFEIGGKVTELCALLTRYGKSHPGRNYGPNLFINLIIFQ